LETRRFVISELYIPDLAKVIDETKVVSTYRDPRFQTLTVEVPLDYVPVIEKFKELKIIWP
jgi:hypothetical protein